jgi:alkanesulfonate monooxygenase SsuD/methylene tetrahydromethanopterin reductase-like flavin-dependent oxidoreductase (luciferase family)
MADSEITIDALMESRLIYGSPGTVASKLTQLRKQVGPFGALLVSGMYWTGPNAAWDRESLTRLAREVLPLLGKQVALDEVT